MVSQVLSNLHSSLFQPPESQEGRTTAERLRVLEASTRTQAQLNIVTADGDRVTLTARAEAGVGLADYRSLASGPGGTLAFEAQVAGFTASRSLEIVTVGDLSKEELHDIGRVVDRIKQVVKKFAKGDLEGAFKKVGKAVERFGEASTLSGFNFTLESHQRLFIGEQSLTTIQSGQRSPSPVSGLIPVLEPEDLSPEEALFLLKQAEALSRKAESSPLGKPDGSTEPGKETEEPSALSTAALVNPPVISDALAEGDDVDDHDDGDSDRAGTDDNSFRRAVDRVLGMVGEFEAEHHRLGRFIPRLLRETIDELGEEFHQDRERFILERFQAEILKQLSEPNDSDTGHRFPFRSAEPFEPTNRLSITI